MARFDYILRHGPKEGLVRCPTEWPGVHCAWHFAQNQWTVRGHWDDLTKRFRMRHVGKKPKTRDYRSDESFTYDPLPCWAHWEPSKIRTWVLERLEAIREMYADQNFPGVDQILRQNLTDAPNESKRSPAPDVHSKDPQVRRDMRKAYREFVRSFYSAAGRLERSLDLSGAPYFFPSGCHPPRPDSVPETAKLAERSLAPRHREATTPGPSRASRRECKARPGPKRQRTGPKGSSDARLGAAGATEAPRITSPSAETQEAPNKRPELHPNGTSEKNLILEPQLRVGPNRIHF